MQRCRSKSARAAPSFKRRVGVMGLKVNVVFADLPLFYLFIFFFKENVTFDVDWSLKLSTSKSGVGVCVVLLLSEVFKNLLNF